MVSDGQFKAFNDSVEGAISIAEDNVIGTLVSINSIMGDFIKLTITFRQDHDKEFKNVSKIFVNHGLPELDDPNAPWANCNTTVDVDLGHGVTVTMCYYYYTRDDVTDDHIAVMEAMWSPSPVHLAVIVNGNHDAPTISI